MVRRDVVMAGIGGLAALLATPTEPLPPRSACGQEKGKEKPADADRVKAEFAALQGTWRCLRWEQEGAVMPEEARRAVRVVVKGESYKSTVDGVNFKEGTLTVTPSATPHEVDAAFDGGVNRAIYVRAGDYLILCVGGERRASEFACGGERGGDSLYVFKIER